MHRYASVRDTARLLVLCTIAFAAFANRTASGAAIPEQDVRNTLTPDTRSKFQAPVYRSLSEWETRSAALRKQVQFAAGLMPMPEKTPLNAKIFGRIENGDYSIEKVYIETFPGFYLAGNLYRPLGKSGKFPGMLAPHGHEAYGRLADGPLFSVPSRGINHARQGYVVFAYDMVGYSDTMQIPHAFGGPREELWGFGPLGLQLWNSIRALDFLQSLPDVDGERIIVTGESGGGTQTFLLCAVDQRPKWSSPVNMISLIMQGGSPCENAAGLRVDTNNVEIGALMAPRPMLMVAATGDWTVNTPREEYPAIKAIYDLYGKGDQVETIQIDAPHNYNKESREAVYQFMAKRVLNDPAAATIKERPIRKERLQDLMVFAGRPLPSNALDLDGLTRAWIAAAKKQNDSIMDREQFRTSLSLSLAAESPAKVESRIEGEKIVLARPGKGDRLPGIWIAGKGAPLLVVHPGGAEAARKSPVAVEAIRAGRPVLLIDAFQTGSAVAPRDRSAKFFLTFNRSDDANRVQDILTALAFLRQTAPGTKVTLAGLEKAAVWTTFAAAISKDPVSLQADLGKFKGEDQDFLDNFYVPGIQRAGGLRAALLLTSKQ